MNDGHPQAGTPTTPPAEARPGPSTIRAGAVALVAACGGWAGLALAGRPLAETRSTLAEGTPWSALPLDVLLTCACAAALAACCLWLLTVTLATALEAVTGLSSAAVRALTPRAVRRGVLLACGLAVGSAAVVGPATAATEAGPGAGLGVPAAAAPELDGLPLPDRPVGELRDARGPEPRPTMLLRRTTSAGPGTSPARPAATGAAQPSPARFRAATAAATEPRAHARYEVRRGDSLWSIARRLRPHGDLGEVDRTWRRVYRVNRPEIGADPDLLIPGTTLRLPVRPTGARRLDGPSGPDSLPHRKDAS